MKKKKRDLNYYLGKIHVSEELFHHAAFPQLYSVLEILDLLSLSDSDVSISEDSKILQILNRDKNTLINIIFVSETAVVIEYTSFLQDVLYCEDIHLDHGRLVNLREYRKDANSIFIEQRIYDVSGLELESKLMVKDMTKVDSKVYLLTSLKRCINGYVASCRSFKRDDTYHKVAELSGYVDLDLRTPYLRVNSDRICTFDSLREFVGKKATYRSPNKISDLEFELYSRYAWPNEALIQFIDKIHSVSMNRPNDACFRKEFSLKDFANKNLY